VTAASSAVTALYLARPFSRNALLLTEQRAAVNGMMINSAMRGDALSVLARWVSRAEAISEGSKLAQVREPSTHKAHDG
jgi:hypothetical protein